MTTLTQTRPFHAVPQGALSRLMTRYRQWADTRATRNALMRLSDRELADIGLTRGDIDTVAARA